MSKMSELSLEIQDLLEQGHSPFTIARQLEIPVTWVFDEHKQEELSPFETINS